MARSGDNEIVRTLKKRAGVRGRSAEAKHRAIPTAAGARPRARSFAKVLASMPDVGLDADFERVDTGERSRHEFD